MQLLSGIDDLPRTGNVRTQLMALWVTAISLALMLVAYAVFPGFWPPMSPEMSAQAVAEFYRDNTGLIRFSMVSFNLFGIMLLPLFCVITVQIKRMAAQSQAFAYCYLMATVRPDEGSGVREPRRPLPPVPSNRGYFDDDS